MTNISKNGKTFRIGALLLVVVLISTVMLSGTFAKYTSEYAGQDTALVAKWSLAMTADGTELGISPSSVSLDLFDHSYNTHINKMTNANEYIIAPGVDGEFVLKMNYLADVDADVKITIEALPGNASVPMEYSVDGTSWVNLDDLSDEIKKSTLEDTGDISTDAAIAATNFRLVKSEVGATAAKTVSQTVKWRWAFDGTTTSTGATDVSDTALGTSSVAVTGPTKYGIKVTIRADQVAPTTTP